MTARNYTALLEYLAGVERFKFSYEPGEGLHECVLFSDRSLVATTGNSRLAEALGGRTYSTAKEAIKLLAEFGGLEAAVDSVMAPVPIAFAQRGDIGLLPANAVNGVAGATLCVVEGEYVAAPGLNGLARIPRRLMRKAWSATAPHL